MTRQVFFRGLCVVLSLALLLPGAVASRAQGGLTQAGGDHVPGEVLVKFRPGVKPVAVSGGVEMGVASLDALAREYGVAAAEPLFADVGYSAQGLERIYKLTLPTTADVLAVAGDLHTDAYVEYAEPNHIYSINEALSQMEAALDSLDGETGDALFPDDSLFGDQWALHNAGQTGGTEDADIDAPEAWGVMTGTTDVMVAIIDTGVYSSHEDLDDGRVRTDIDRDYVNDDDDATDDHGHGTHVAGTIAAETNNGVGVAGVMWQAQILPLKVLNRWGIGSSDDIASAIRYAADQGADVINMSLGGLCSQTIADAVNYAYFDQGVVIVAAAGNSGGSITYPAKHAPVIAVGATDYNDERAYFSCYGGELDVVAPGVGIWSTVPNYGYDRFSGTSMASPHVTGVAGLLLAQRPELSNGQVREILRQSADDLGDSGFDHFYGYGRVNAYQALQTATPDEPPAPEEATCPSLLPCAASTALAGEEAGPSVLGHLRAVRDEVFTQDPGRRWTRIYYEHQFEVARLLLSDSQLRADVQAGLLAFDPVFRALLDGDGAGEPVILTPELIQAAERALMGVAERSSPAVHDDIVREWEKVDPDRFVGWDVRKVWEQLRLEQTKTIYLPILLR